MGERDADGVVDLRRRGEGRIEILPVKLAHQLEADLARNFPVEFAAGEFAGRLAADMDGERRRGGVEELLGVVVGEDDPEVGLERAQPFADVGCDLAHMGDQRLVLGVRHGEELRRMGQHGAADHGRHHGGSPCRKAIARGEGQQARAGVAAAYSSGIEKAALIAWTALCSRCMILSRIVDRRRRRRFAPSLTRCQREQLASMRSRPPCAHSCFTGSQEADSFAPARGNALRGRDGRSSGNDRLRQLRSHAGDQGRQGES